MGLRSLFTAVIGLAFAASLAASAPARADAGLIVLLGLGGIVAGSSIDLFPSSAYSNFPPRTDYTQCRPGVESCARQRLCGYNPQGEYYCYFQ